MTEAIRTWARACRGLTWSLWANVGLLLLAAGAMPFDHRRILGLNPWVKPMKFDLSAIVFVFTMAVLLRLLGDGRGWVRGLTGSVFGVAMVVETTLISMQSLRGVPSHMNYRTVFDAVVFAVMGLVIALNTVAILVLLVAWCRARPVGVPRVLQWGVRLGLLLIFAGSLEGLMMVVNNGHTVGARDGGAGLPFVNWSVGHGDLRVAHFFGIHALQAMVLLGWGLSRVRWPDRRRLGAMVGGCAVYVAGVWALFAQAMAGRPWVR